MYNYTNIHFRCPPTMAFLEESGFSYLDSQEGTKYYQLRFPIIWDETLHIPTLFCFLTTNDDTWNVIVDVRTHRGTYYPGFYSQEYGVHEPLLSMMHRKINGILKRLGIVHRKEYRHGKKEQSELFTQKTFKNVQKAGEKVSQRTKSKEQTSSKAISISKRSRLEREPRKRI